MTHKIAILGASGYTGAELVRLIASHPQMQIVALSADRKAGLQMAAVFPFLRHLDLPGLVKIDDIDFANVDLCFCALPHATSQEVIAKLPKDLKIIDLSADFRLRDPADYLKWYGQPHAAPEVQKQAVYGLTEFYRDDIRKARLVAGTGCNAAAGQFALRPLIAAQVIDLDDILIDLKAGVSGAGRSLKENLLHAELSGGTHAYSAGGSHRCARLSISLPCSAPCQESVASRRSRLRALPGSRFRRHHSRRCSQGLPMLTKPLLLTPCRRRGSPMRSTVAQARSPLPTISFTAQG